MVSLFFSKKFVDVNRTNDISVFQKSKFCTREKTLNGCKGKVVHLYTMWHLFHMKLLKGAIYNDQFTPSRPGVYPGEGGGGVLPIYTSLVVFLEVVSVI